MLRRNYNGKNHKSQYNVASDDSIHTMLCFICEEIEDKLWISWALML